MPLNHKTKHRLLLSLNPTFLLIFFLFPTLSVIGQNLTIDNLSQPSGIEIGDLQTLDDPNGDLSVLPNPYYTVFIVFNKGDGIYYKKNIVDGGFRFDHAFNVNGNVQLGAKAYISDRYAEPDPPGLIVEVDDSKMISGGFPPTPIPPLVDVANGRLIGVDTNHHILDGKKNVFAISANFTGESFNKILFFYNGKLNGPNPPSPTPTPGVFSLRDCFLMQNSALTACQPPYDATLFDSANGTSFSNLFEKVVEYLILPGAMEQRIFYAFENALVPGSADYKFLLLHASQSSSSNNWANLPAHASIISSYIPSTGMTGGFFVEDLELIEPKVLLPGDPSELIPTDTCRCCDSKGPFQLSADYNFYNVGEDAAKQAWIKIDNRDNNFDFSCLDISYNPKYRARPAIPIEVSGTPGLYEINGIGVPPAKWVENIFVSGLGLKLKIITSATGTQAAMSSQPPMLKICSSFQRPDNNPNSPYLINKDEACDSVRMHYPDVNIGGLASNSIAPGHDSCLTSCNCNNFQYWWVCYFNEIMGALAALGLLALALVWRRLNTGRKQNKQDPTSL